MTHPPAAVSAARFIARLVLAGAVGLAAGVASATPAKGVYDATMCVTLNDAPPSCGPSQLEILRSGNAVVRIADIEYHLALTAPQEFSAVLMQGTMQIHEFNTRFQWQGSRLQFADVRKNARYELQLGDRRPGAPTSPAASAVKR